MRNQFVLTATLIVAGLMVAGPTANAAPKDASDGMVLVKGGSFKNTKSNYYGQGVTVGIITSVNISSRKKSGQM